MRLRECSDAFAGEGRQERQGYAAKKAVRAWKELYVDGGNPPTCLYRGNQ